MRKTNKLALALVLVALLCGAAGLVVACGSTSSQQEQTEWVETEDCDAEDWAHYEAECHRASPKPKPTATKTKVVLAPTPAPRRTRR